MESKSLTLLTWQIFICLVLLILHIKCMSTNSQPEIISTQDQYVAYLNHSAKLSCIILNRNQRHVTWSRIHIVNETQKLAYLLYVDLVKYTSLNHYHLTYIIDKDNREHWNLEIRQVRLSDEGYYSCLLTAIKPIKKIFYIKVIDNTKNFSVTLRSVLDSQSQQATNQHQTSSSSSSNVTLPFITLFLIGLSLAV